MARKASRACARASRLNVPFFSAEVKASCQDIHSQRAFPDVILQYSYTSNPEWMMYWAAADRARLNKTGELRIDMLFTKKLQRSRASNRKSQTRALVRRAKKALIFTQYGCPLSSFSSQLSQNKANVMISLLEWSILQQDNLLTVVRILKIHLQKRKHVVRWIFGRILLVLVGV